jgi:predicted phage replisome organizer
MSDTKKYYWLKLKRDFFKRHDIKIIESMENGKDYVLFYLKLLLESVDHEGELRFSETVPYNDKMLSTITDTNIDIVRSAVKIFSELGMMETFDDGTLYMEQVSTMLGYETSDAMRMREAREKKKQLLIAHGEIEQCSESFENRSPELEIELDKEIEKDKKQEIKPEKHKYGTYQNVLLTDDEKQRLVVDFHSLADMAIQYLSEYKIEKDYKTKNDNLTIRRWVVDAVRKKEGLPTLPKQKAKTDVRLCPHCHVPLRGSACPQCYANFDMNGKEI